QNEENRQVGARPLVPWGAWCARVASSPCSLFLIRRRTTVSGTRKTAISAPSRRLAVEARVRPQASTHRPQVGHLEVALGRHWSREKHDEISAARDGEIEIGHFDAARHDAGVGAGGEVEILAAAIELRALCVAHAVRDLERLTGFDLVE